VLPIQKCFTLPPHERQPFLHNDRPPRGRCHCHCRCHLRHQLCRCCHRRGCCRCRCNHPLPLPLPLAIAIGIAVNHHRRHLCHLPVSHCWPPPSLSRCPCRRPLPSSSPSAIAVAIAVSHCHCHAVGHFQELLPWRGKKCIQPIEAKNAYLILFCSDSGRRIDRSRMTDQVSSGNGQHQGWAASSEQ
jgi:hypothetical protein